MTLAVSEPGGEPGPESADGAAAPTAEDALADILAAAEEDAGRIVDVDQPTQQFVVVRLGEQRFAFLGGQIAKILAPLPIWPVPGCPDAVEGVIDVRGETWSVIRLASLIGIAIEPRQGAGDAEAILLGRTSSMLSGLRVDEVLDVIDLELSRVLPLPDTLPEQLQPVATGLLDDPGRADSRILILDLDPLFDRWLASVQ